VLLSDSCGYVALSHDPGVKRIIVAFRGTYSITNTIIDLSAYPQSYVPYPGNSTENNKDETRPRKCENCTVHAGFMSSWKNTRETILPHISDALEKNPDYEVTLVGHSLGGAIAALAGLEMQMMGWNPIVTTFGEPMVGNAGFARFLEMQFQLGKYGKSDDLEKQRFRRVTHIDDPIPLLPLREWGYAPHAGEIFISRPNLPPTVEDVNICIGDQDVRCIAGSESPNHLLDIYQDIDIPLNIFEDKPIESCTSDMESALGTEQQVIGEKDSPKDTRSSKCTLTDSTGPLYPRGWDWSFIPARYRLWELFYAHRDYFWRIGLCVPGGDPTG